MAKYVVTHCPFCGKEFEERITFSAEFYRQVARDRVQRIYEGHVPICYKNPDALKSAPISLPEYQEVTR